VPRIEPIPWDELPAKARETIQAGMEAKKFSMAMPLQILAYAEHDHVPDDGNRHPYFAQHLLDGKLLELLRIRSAQLGGCEPCQASRKNENVTEEAVVCLTDPALRADLLSTREKLAIEFLDRMCTDHHSIGDDMYRRLGEHFTIAEIIELGTTIAGMMGHHRFMHTLNVFGDSDPVLRYDPRQVGATWAEAHAEDAQAAE